MKLMVETLISGRDTGEALAVFDEITPARAGPPLHRHRHQIEIFHVIRGRYRFLVDGRETQATAGDCLIVPAGAAHTFQNLDDEASELHFELLPAGQAERFFERAVAGDFDENKMAEFFEEFDMDLLGPPLD